MDSRTERLFTMAQEDTRYRAGEVAVKSLYDQGEAVALRSEDFTCT